MNICLLFWILLPAAECGSHSLEFLSTGRVQPGSGLHFEQVTEFDGVVISHCDSGTQQEHFKPVLESHNLTGTCRAACYDVFDALKAISKFINHTRNVQRRRGCITSDKRLESAFDNWAVNGEGFIQFDAGAQKWKALSPSAEMIKDSWNGYEARNHLFGQFIRRYCLEMIHQIKLKETEKRTDGNTLDGRHILYIQMTLWRIIGIIFTVCCLISVMTLLFTREEKVMRKLNS
ncbi:zinc-alpha-2-glycoprotein-like isoform X2 [Takifugu rubripes]|uniref:zinc-alpha-2-glycoprotein-like isoform X2 n=1 Tax=Takifugu rubripes TaxID=31033 RepID=UPI001145B8EB|nr:zinc-alpha-2-glycoprotein-like isoform X2 [Takifugu rubripes]